MSFVFPIKFNGDAPALVAMDYNGNRLNDTLDENTYATFGTIPKGGSSTLTLYVKNTGQTPIYSVKCEGLPSSQQLGEAANTYEAVDLPRELGNIGQRETIELAVVWTVPADAPTGMKIFGIRATDSSYFEILESHNHFVKITITNNDTDLLDDFPIEIDFDATSIDWAKTSPDGRDIRFYDENFKELKYYIESWIPPLETAKVFVRIPRLCGHETKHIYVGYGNFNLPTLSDVHGKYEVHEDFDGGFDESWVALKSNYNFTSNAGCVTVSNPGSLEPIPTLVLTLKTPLKSEFVVEFAAKYEQIGIGTPNTVSLAFFSSVQNYDGYVGLTTNPFRLYQRSQTQGGSSINYVGHSYGGTHTTMREFKIVFDKNSVYTYYPPTTLVQTTSSEKGISSVLCIAGYSSDAVKGALIAVNYVRIYRYLEIPPTITFEDVADITTEFTNPEVDSGIICVIGNVVRQLQFNDYDFKKIIYEVGYNNAYWRVPGSAGGIYVWGKLEMRPLYGEDVSFVDNLYANDAYFYTFTDYQYDVHDKLDVEGVLYDIKAIQVHDAGRETIYKTLVLKRQPEYYACCVGVVS